MTSHLRHRIQIPWGDIGPAMQALEDAACGPWQALPLGNRVVVDCAHDADATLLLGLFVQARSLSAARND